MTHFFLESMHYTSDKGFLGLRNLIVEGKRSFVVRAVLHWNISKTENKFKNLYAQFE